MTIPSVREIEEAQQRTDKQVSSELRAVLAHIHACNYGLAKDHLEALLRMLPHDHGAQVFRPLFNVKLAEVQGVDPDTYDQMLVEGYEP